MRKLMPSFIFASTTFLISGVGLAVDKNLIGKPAVFELIPPAVTAPVKPVVQETPAVPQIGELLETPNQFRRRLGLTIAASYPTTAYGAAEETPNHRRQRLAHAIGVPGTSEQVASIPSTH